MTSLEFVEKIVSHLAWPAVVVIAILSFRKSAINLVEKLSKIKHGDTELNFQKEINEIIAESQDQGVTILRPVPFAAFSNNSGEAPQDLQVLLLRSWAGVEGVLNDWFSKRAHEIAAKKTMKFPATTRAKIEFLNDYEIINPSLYRLLVRFLSIRNTAAHADNFSVSLEEATELRGLAMSLNERLKGFLSNFDDKEKKLHELG